MKVLIYKRTHTGDPNENGIFGNDDCMGKVRNWDFDAVIGIGGKQPWKNSENIKLKINWIGLDPKKITCKHLRGDQVVFGHFALYEDNGVNIEIEYPYLYKYMYGSRKRFDMSPTLPEEVLKEVNQILDSVKNNPPSNSFYSVNIDATKQTNEKIYTCNGCIANTPFTLSVCEC